ncbi:MAG: type II toxin-antitoxin system VapB family antitoxin, partial [Caldilinea sp.]|nr:type II toxin-antitoxin system VapB family antitoxin [Caldilinea sp.]
MRRTLLAPNVKYTRASSSSLTQTADAALFYQARESIHLGGTRSWWNTIGNHAMSLNIKNREAYELARELARLTGASMTEVVLSALRKQRADVCRQQQKQQQKQQLMAIAQRCAAHIQQPARAVEHGELLYDEAGLPLRNISARNETHTNFGCTSRSWEEACVAPVNATSAAQHLVTSATRSPKLKYTHQPLSD